MNNFPIVTQKVSLTDILSEELARKLQEVHPIFLNRNFSNTIFLCRRKTPSTDSRSLCHLIRDHQVWILPLLCFHIEEYSSNLLVVSAAVMAPPAPRPAWGPAKKAPPAAAAAPASSSISPVNATPSTSAMSGTFTFSDSPYSYFSFCVCLSPFDMVCACDIIHIFICMVDLATPSLATASPVSAKRAAGPPPEPNIAHLASISSSSTSPSVLKREVVNEDDDLALAMRLQQVFKKKKKKKKKRKKKIMFTFLLLYISLAFFQSSSKFSIYTETWGGERKWREKNLF